MAMHGGARLRARLPHATVRAAGSLAQGTHDTAQVAHLSAHAT